VGTLSCRLPRHIPRRRRARCEKILCSNRGKAFGSLRKGDRERVLRNLAYGDIVLLAFAALGHGMDPKLLDDPVITAIAQRIQKTPAQVALAWAVQRGTAFLTTSTKPHNIRASFEISTLPEDAMQEIRDGITTSVRFNTVVETGVPGFIPRVR
jgi:diketogulonate reductase-like aldo/keto reductase